MLEHLLLICRGRLLLSWTTVDSGQHCFSRKTRGHPTLHQKSCRRGRYLVISASALSVHNDPSFILVRSFCFLLACSGSGFDSDALLAGDLHKFSRAFSRICTLSSMSQSRMPLVLGSKRQQISTDLATGKWFVICSSMLFFSCLRDGESCLEVWTASLISFFIKGTKESNMTAADQFS